MTGRDEERDYWDRHAGNYDRSMLLLGRPMSRMVELAAQAVLDAPRVLEVAAIPIGYVEGMLDAE